MVAIVPKKKPLLHALKTYSLLKPSTWKRMETDVPLDEGVAPCKVAGSKAQTNQDQHVQVQPSGAGK